MIMASSSFSVLAAYLREGAWDLNQQVRPKATLVSTARVSQFFSADMATALGALSEQALNGVYARRTGDRVQGQIAAHSGKHTAPGSIIFAHKTSVRAS